ncbi:UNVERIFIED_CONTAM: hypothetical protein FKN15_065250 [Acipenser sinensis]
MAMVCLTDFEEYAKEHLPKATWDYYAAGADECCTRDDNLLAYKRTYSTCSMEEIVEAAPNGYRWFQLYVYRNRKVSEQIVHRVEALGYKALENNSPEEYGIPANTLDPSISWKDIYWLQSLTCLPIVIKGILTKEDAELAVEHGVQGIIVSNHGGRQLDGGPATNSSAPPDAAGCVRQRHPDYSPWHRDQFPSTEAVNTCYITSTYSTCSMEEIVEAAPNGYRWFQLYVYRNRKVSEQIVHRVEALGYKALVLTVDVPYTGKRRNDLRNQFRLPPHLKVKNFDGVFEENNGPEEYGIPANTLDPSISWKDIYWLQSLTRLPIVIKGILTKEDAELAVEHGVQGIIVSNHGGRQLDGGPATIDALAEIVDTVQGRIEVYLDGGVRTGSDVLKAIAVGAKCVFIGRPVVWGLAYKGFDQFRSDETLCDVVLVSGEGSESFPVHRVLMASSSDYFKAMFTGGMKEQELKTIKLQGLSCVGLKNIIDFIYTAKVALNMDNLQDTLEAASFLQIMPVLDFCKELLISEVTTDNCVEVGRISSVYHLTEVSSFINEFVLKNFSVLLKEGQYLQLSEDSMAHALASDNLKNCTEMELFKHTCDWLKHDESRKAHTYKLMKNIRFPLMTPSELLQISNEADFLRADAACVNLLLEASNYQMMPYMQPIMQTERTHIRSDANHLVTLGGVLRQQLVVSKELRLFDEDTKNWKALKPMDVPRYQHGIAVIGNFLYIVGGQSNYDTKGKTAVDSVYRYDPRFNRWLQVASLNEKRTFFHLSALKGKLYAVGGRNTTGEIVVSKELRLFDEDTKNWKALKPMDVPRYQHGIAVIGNFLYIVGGQSNYDTKGKTAVDSVYRYDPRFNRWLQVASLNEKRTFFHLSALKGKLYAVGGRNTTGEIASVECYNLRNNEWTCVAPISEPHYGHAGTVHGELMYISGGITHDTFQKQLTCYDPDTNTWSRKADMSTLRGLHCMCTIEDRLYVIGGNHFRGTNDYDDVLSCEYYCPGTDQWTAIAPMLSGQSDVGVAVFKSKIYVIGGYSWNSRCMVEIVQCYDPEKDEWEKVFDVLEPLGGIRACSLIVHPPEDTVESQTQEYPVSTKS